MIASPCTKVCVMSEASGLCRGCYRTLDEIACWGTMSEAERSAVVAKLPARRADAPPAQPAPGESG